MFLYPYHHLHLPIFVLLFSLPAVSKGKWIEHSLRCRLADEIRSVCFALVLLHLLHVPTCRKAHRCPLATFSHFHFRSVCRLARLIHVIFVTPERSNRDQRQSTDKEEKKKKKREHESRKYGQGVCSFSIHNTGSCSQPSTGTDGNFRCATVKSIRFATPLFDMPHVCCVYVFVYVRAREAHVCELNGWPRTVDCQKFAYFNDTNIHAAYTQPAQQTEFEQICENETRKRAQPIGVDTTMKNACIHRHCSIWPI